MREIARMLREIADRLEGMAENENGRLPEKPAKVRWRKLCGGIAWEHGCWQLRQSPEALRLRKPGWDGPTCIKAGVGCEAGKLIFVDGDGEEAYWEPAPIDRYARWELWKTEERCGG